MNALPLLMRSCALQDVVVVSSSSPRQICHRGWFQQAQPRTQGRGRTQSRCVSTTTTTTSSNSSSPSALQLNDYSSSRRTATASSSSVHRREPLSTKSSSSSSPQTTKPTTTTTNPTSSSSSAASSAATTAAASTSPFLLLGTITRTGTMTSTIQLTTQTQTFDPFLQKHYTRPRRRLAHDPFPSGLLRAGDVVEFGLFSQQEQTAKEAKRRTLEERLVEKGVIKLKTRRGKERDIKEIGVKGRKVKWVVRRVVTPFGKDVEDR